ncbi:MAG: hypothetical protein DWI25_07345 [Planctomycetota bacterium]|nr:MAG: hypothetical protein DWI25_07345 [Planctomycetota bacterium]
MNPDRFLFGCVEKIDKSIPDAMTVGNVAVVAGARATVAWPPIDWTARWLSSNANKIIGTRWQAWMTRRRWHTRRQGAGFPRTVDAFQGSVPVGGRITAFGKHRGQDGFGVDAGRVGAYLRRALEGIGDAIGRGWLPGIKSSAHWPLTRTLDRRGLLGNVVVFADVTARGVK